MKIELTPDNTKYFPFNSFKCKLTVFLALLLLTLPAIAERNPSIALLKNPAFQVKFDLTNGTFDAATSDNPDFINNAFVLVHTDTESIPSTDPRFTRSHTTCDFSDNLGHGKKITIHCKDNKSILDLDITISIYTETNCLTITTDAINVSGRDLGIVEIQTLVVSNNNNGSLKLSNQKGQLKVSTQGYYFTDPGTLADLNNTPIGSWWNIAIYDHQNKKAMVAGFITKQTSEPYFTVNQPTDLSPSAFLLETHSTMLMPGRTTGQTDTYKTWSDPTEHKFGKKYPVTLKKQNTLNSDLLILILDTDPHNALEKYAQLTRQYNQFEQKFDVPMGWSTWPYYYWAIDEKVVLDNADFVARHLKQYGMEYIQIDGGWQKKAGLWQAEPKLFPHGMKWLAQQITKRGLKPAIWISPFEIDETSDVFKNHKDWLFKKRDGSLHVMDKAHSKATKLVYKTPEGNLPKVYGLDVTHPEARKWLYDLFVTVSQDWGYKFIKIDWAYTTYCMAQSYYDQTKTKAQAYRLAIETIRQGIGDDCYFMNAGPQTTMGLVDSARMCMDSAATWDNISMSNGQARCIGRHYYEHKNLWCNDPDMLMLRAPLTPAQIAPLEEKRRELDDKLGMGGFTLQQAQSLASIIALSGGQLLNGDNLPQLAPERLDILKKILPVYDTPAIPLDLFENPFPSVYHHKIEKPFDQWDILTVFNWTDNVLEKNINLLDLGLLPAETYLVYDFWNQKFLGQFNTNISLSLKPGTVKLLSIRKMKNVPQVISTDRHITQGAVDLLNVKWDESNKTLQGQSKCPPDQPYTITVYAPKPYSFKKTTTTAIIKNTPQSHDKTIQLKITQKNNTPINWQIKFK
jgi:hypothetical protein